jgi:hypothetical protein
MSTSIKGPQQSPAAHGGRLPAGWWSWPWIAAAAVTAFYFLTSVQIAGHRLLWFDEIETVLFSRAASVSRMLDVMAHVDNNMPAPYFLVVHWFFRLLGEGPVVVRLPSALAMAAGLWITFDCARRLTDGLHGLIALLVLACSCVPYYGFEARSYGIYFLLASFCFWIWVHGRRKLLSALLFGAAFFLSVMFHYYAVFALLPYAAWEILGWKRWRMPSANLTAGGLAVCCSAAVLAPQMSGAKRYAAIFWSPPSLWKLRNTFPDLLPDGLFLLALILIWIAVTTRRGKAADIAPMGAAESIGWLGLLVPFAGYVVARFVSNAYISRYFLGILPGIAVAFSCWSWRHFRYTRLVPAGIFLILAGQAIQTQLTTLRHPESINPMNQQTATRHALQIEDRLRAEEKRFTVLDNGLLYLELWYYAKDPQRYVLLVPSPQYREAHNTVRYVTGLALYYPMQFWDLDDLRKHTAEAALLDPTEETRQFLEKDGWAVERRFSSPVETDYLQLTRPAPPNAAVL